MKKTMIVLSIVMMVLCGLFVSGKYSTTSKTISEICSMKMKDVNEIMLVDGNTGIKTKILDRNEIARIFTAINLPKYNYKGKNEYNGFSLEVKFFSSGKLRANVFFPSNKFMSVGGKLYLKVSNNLDLDKLRVNYKLKNTLSHDSYKSIETYLYKISIPNNIEVKQQDRVTLYFIKDKKNIGGLDMLSWNPDEPDHIWNPNNSIILSSTKLKNFKYEVLQKRYELYPSAESGDTQKTKLTHLFFVFKEKKIVFDLYSETSIISEKTLLLIAKSFTLK